MDKLIEEFNKASQLLVEAQSRIMAIGNVIHSVEKDLAILYCVETSLLSNIGVMKRRKMIIIAGEFKKAVRDLKNCQDKMAFLRLELDNNRRIQERTKIEYDKVRSKYDVIYDKLHNPPNNVIVFRKKDGQK